jgi:hypothetical protein
VPFLLRVPRAVAVVPGPAKRAAIAAALQTEPENADALALQKQAR